MELSSDNDGLKGGQERESIDGFISQLPAAIREDALPRQHDGGIDDDDSSYYYSESGNSVSDSSGNEPVMRLTNNNGNDASAVDDGGASPNNGDVLTLVVYNPDVGFIHRDAAEKNATEREVNDAASLQLTASNYQLVAFVGGNDDFGSVDFASTNSSGSESTLSAIRLFRPPSGLIDDDDHEASTVSHGGDTRANEDEGSAAIDEGSFVGMQLTFASREGSAVDEEGSFSSSDSGDFHPDPEGEYSSSGASLPAEIWGRFDELRDADRSTLEESGSMRFGLSEMNGRSSVSVESNALNQAGIRENDETNDEMNADVILGERDVDSRSSVNLLGERFHLDRDDSDSSSSSSDDESGGDDSDSSTDYSLSYSSTLRSLDGEENETDFEDEEDRVAFEGIKKCHYRKRVIPFKQTRKVTFNYSFGIELSHLGKDRVGQLLSLANHIKQTLVYIEENDELSCLFSRDFEQHELRRFYLSSERTYRIHPSEVWGLKRYLAKAPSLKRLLIHNISLGLDDLNALIADFSGEALNLQNTGNGDALGPIVLTMLDTTNLKSLTLSENSVGMETCRVLADFLSSDKTSIQSLDLSHCQIDDDCVQLLIESLKTNTKLTTLDLSQNEAITNQTWRSFEKLLYDSSSFDTVFGSNHVLQCILGFPTLDDTEGWESRLECLLDMNRNWMFNFDDSSPECLWLKRRTKIFHYITGQESHHLKVDLFFGIKALAMPRVIEFIGRNRYPSSYNVKNLFSEENDIDSSNLNVMYQLVRSWEMPSLFSFPSREKLQLTSKIDQLEKEKSELLDKILKLRKFVSLLVFLLEAFLATCALFSFRQQ